MICCSWAKIAHAGRYAGWTMADIQLDMFEVQLAAAILLSSNVSGRNVKVLADPGVRASGYAADHVLQKLNQIYGDGPRRIDLIIGTH